MAIQITTRQTEKNEWKQVLRTEGNTKNFEENGVRIIYHLAQIFTQHIFQFRRSVTYETRFLTECYKTNQKLFQLQMKKIKLAMCHQSLS